MDPGRDERTFQTLGAARGLLGLALAVGALQALHGAWLCAAALLAAGPGRTLPTGLEALVFAVALAGAALFLRQADENAQALAGGGRVLPPLSLARLLQPRAEHALGELWSRSDPGAPGDPLPASRSFGLLWGAAFGLGLPLWAFALAAPAVAERAQLAAGVLQHLLTAAACGASLHFAAHLQQRQDEAWARLRPSLITVPIRAVRRAAAGPGAVAAAAPGSAGKSGSESGSAAASAPASAAAAAAAAVSESASVPASGSGSRSGSGSGSDSVSDSAPSSASAPLPPPARCPLCSAPLASRRCDACGAPALAGPFRVLRALGGSRGRRTLLAEAPDGAKVVLKELSLSGAPDAQALDAFAREGRTLRELRHPKLPVYVDAFQEDDGPRARLYLAYRHLEGVPLHQELEERRYTEDEVLDLVEELLEILRHLHGLQPPLIHRDLKPANLIRRPDGSVALIDFGVARDLETTLHSGTLVGTVGYMPPEQLAGQVDLTCDLYALGATALHLLTRRPPWEFMDGPELRLPPLKSAPAARRILQRLVAPRRSQRFASAREALAALRRARGGGLQLSRGRLAAAAVGVATVAAVGFGVRARVAAAEAQQAAEAAAAEARREEALRAAQRAAEQEAANRPRPLPGGGAADPAEPPIASWSGGRLGREELEAGLRLLPPWLKSSRPWWVQQHVQTAVRRKLLVAEGERRGFGSLAPASAPAAERERLVARMLLEAEQRAEPDPNRARALRSAFTRVGERLWAEARVSIDEGRLFRLDPERLHGSPPPSAPERGAPARFELQARTGPCSIEVEPALRRYGGRCEGVATLSEALLDPETLALLDLAPGSVLPSGFVSRYTDDFAEERLLGGGGRDTLALAEAVLVRIDARLSEATGAAPPDAGQALLAAVDPALRRCLALSLFAAEGGPKRARVSIRLELRPGGAHAVRLESDPPLPSAICARALDRPEVGGVGALGWTFELDRR